ncbi:MAG: hypothetical protein ACLSXV_07475 [Lachnospira pectinoschiza]|jgi:hypothetical protein
MIRRNLLKATLLTTVIATLLVSTACGSKNTASTNNDTAQSVQATTAKTVTKETEKNSDNNNTETTSEANAENESTENNIESNVENAEVVVSENNNTEQEIIVADNNNISESNDGNSYVEDNNNNNNNEVIVNDTPNVDVVDNTPAPAPADTTPVIDNTPASAEIEKPVKQPVSTTPYEYDPMDGSTYTGYNLWRTWRRQFIGLGGEMITSDEAFAHIKNICERYASGSLTKEQAEKELWTCESDLSDINGVTAKSFITDGKYPTITNYDDYAKLNWDINDGVEAVDAGMTCYTILYYNPAEDKTIFYYVGINLTNYK